jgi:molecular chaperone IbpA
MTRVTTLSLPNFSRQLVGIDNLFRALDTNPIKYPLINILQHGNAYRIDVALAGFSKDDIDVILEGRELIIQTKKDYKQNDPRLVDSLNEEYDPSEQICLHKDISYRPFIRTFKLVEYMDVTNVEMKNGILSINLQLQIPEKLKPKAFTIQNAN